MLPLIFEMKILKYTFNLPKLEVSEDGELTYSGTTKETYTFTLLHKGVGLFEELTDIPLMAYLTSMVKDNEEQAVQKLLDKAFIPNLACASYVKIENGKFHNNRSTAEEFKKTSAYQHITEDMTFTTKLVEMAIECILGEEKAKQNTKSNVASSKK